MRKPKKDKRKLQPGDCRHGTLSGYIYWNCRCTKCTDLMIAYTAAKKVRLTDPKNPHSHGKASTYRYGCRCAPCTLAFRNKGGWNVRGGYKYPTTDMSELA